MLDQSQDAATEEAGATSQVLAVSGCRLGCAACCIAPSISSPLPGMPNGKPAGVACPQLDDQLRCKLFGLPERPAVCVRLRPQPSMCGASREEAVSYLEVMEKATAPPVDKTSKNSYNFFPT